MTPNYGRKCSEITKEKLRQKQLGVPAPKGSGHGISGHYKNFYFRSSYELSFLIQNSNILENIQSGEKLDKDRFRQGLGGLKVAYEQVLNRILGK
jgi:hypothetical protein